MSITVKYFASLAERLGRREESIEFTPGLTAGQGWSRLSGPELPPTLCEAVSQDDAGAEAPRRDGDELAFLPPITGGAK
jgi:molybdopterin synthase sulfur carrier subunit